MSLKRKLIISSLAAATTAVAEVDDNYDEHLFDCCCSTLQPNDDILAVACPLIKSRRTYVQGFVDSVVPNYSLSEFKQHFRMSRSCYEKLLAEVQPILTASGKARMHTETKVLLTLWTLGNQECFRQIGDRFSVDRGSAHQYCMQVCEALSSLQSKFVNWPTPDKIPLLSKDFNFPYTFGAVDGSHIEIKAPLDSMADYTNRKSYTSVVLQAVCDANLRFTDISTGWPGSMHDARIFRLSSLSHKLEILPSSGYHILGDSAYPLTKELIVPFKDNGHLSPDQLKFNYIHSSSRNVIERAFGRLKGKWRRLKYLDMVNIQQVTSVITAACVLHNFVLTTDSDKAADEHSVDTPSITCTDDCETGHEKRQRILAML